MQTLYAFLVLLLILACIAIGMDQHRHVHVDEGQARRDRHRIMAWKRWRQECTLICATRNTTAKAVITPGCLCRNGDLIPMPEVAASPYR